MNPHPSQVDQNFLEYVETGSPRALARVFDAVAGELLLLAGHLTADPHAAEDLLQSTFLEAMRVKDSYARTGSVKAWLGGILANQARMEWRRLRRRLDAGRLRAERLADPDIEVEAREFFAELRRAMETVPGKYREVLRLGLLQGLSIQEIAVAVDRPPQTVKTQMRRGMALLRGALPSSIMFSAVVALTPGRGLAAVRDQVLARAEWMQAAAAGGGAVSSGSSALVLAHKAWIGAGCVALAVVTAFLLGQAFWADPEGVGAGRTQTSGEAPRSAAPSGVGGDGSGQGGEAVLRREVAGAPDGPAAGSGGLIVRAFFAATSGPAPLSVVSAVPVADVGWLREERVRTGDDGLAVFDRLPAGRVRVRGDRGGIGEVEIVAGRIVRHELEIPAGLRVEGEVLDRDGAPVVGARLWLVPGGSGMDEGVEVARSQAGGRFEIDDVEPGRWLTAFDGSRYVPIPVTLDGAVGGSTVVRLQFRGTGASLVGTVRGPDGRPLAGAAVLVGWVIDPRQGAIMPAFRMRTDAGGGFVAAGLPGSLPVPVWVRAEGTATFHRRLEPIGPGASAFVAVDLAAGADVTGRVRTADGAPVVGAKIEARPDGAGGDCGPDPAYRGPAWALDRTRSVADGSFALAAVAAGQGELVAEKPGTGVASRSYEFRGGEQSVWEPRLEVETDVLEGRLLDGEGRPLVGIEVGLQWPTVSPSLLPATRVTDAAGRFQAPGRLGAPFRLQVRDPRSAIPAEPFPLEGTCGSGAHDFTVPQTVLATASIRGVLEDRARAPAPTMARVTLVREVGLRMVVFPLEVPLREGVFAAGPLPPGAYHLYLAHEDSGPGLYAGRLELAPGQLADVGVRRCEPAGALRVSVVDPGGRPTALAKIKLASPAGPLSQGIPLVGGRGELPALQPGAWFLQGFHPECVPLYQRVEIRSGETSECVVQLEPGHPVELRYTAAPAAGVVTWLSISRSQGGKESLLYRGLHVIPPGFRQERIALPAGEHRIEIRHPDGTAAGTVFTVATDAVVPTVVPVAFP